MKKGDAVIVNPFNCGNIHVGIVDKITDELVQCKEWYGIGTPNCVMGSTFHKSIVKKVSMSIFCKAKKAWNNE